ncbi:MAG: Rpn family recombination-promoting nuclease/putative transposase [Planctomycetaceae bacterium]|nr:Rpn family recombination-promoting nuclease/putative transposase [Planctomycetaceae bacterium]
MPRYINPYTDFGSKKLFGEEANKDLLIYRDNRNVLEIARIEGKAEIARKIKEEGLPSALIYKLTGLSEAHIENWEGD